jgi:putative membrane protein
MSERAARIAIGAVSAAVVLGVGALMLGPKPEAGAAAPGISALPRLNAALNGSSALLLATGWVLIRRRRVAAHRACMVTAFGVSTLFLISYVVYHAQAGSVRFTGQGPVRAVYFFLLATHIVLAAAIVPLALVTLYRAFSGQLARHRRIARWTLPIWLYVSVTGVLVYWMLYHLSPSR